MSVKPRLSKSLVQFLLVMLLVALPVLMIIFNGQDAVKGLLWKEHGEEVRVEETTEIQALQFGIYDPEDKWQNESYWDIEHLYISWLYFNEDSLRQQLINVHEQGSDVLLTIEPWAHNGDGLFQDITSGKYSKEIIKLREAISTLEGKVYISWGHEMDQDLTKRYDWSAGDPGKFIEAYRYVHSALSTGVKTDIRWIWAPVVKTSSSAYWPGDDYVDIIGLPIYSFPTWDRSYYGHLRSFEQSFTEKYNIIARYNKPVFIIEFGVTGSSDYQAYWMQQAFLSLNEFPLLKGIIFFYSKDTEKAWGEDVPTPDWRSDSTLIHGIVDWYRAR